MKKIIVFLFLLSGFAMHAQNKNAKASIDVDGVCMMCKKRIETTAIKIKGVKLATWDLDAKKLSIVYNDGKTDVEAIQKSIAGVGHDTKLFKAPDEAYNSIDACCKYRDPEVVENHNTGKQKH